ncbi:hypothetical protein ACIQPQ_14260 [Streptomyces sp. NPDC091281]|uniref:hypothetical protein n=1 Tax=Streptomyces sp. NPDC091281 TaxID=3365985 RepID=UPI0038001C6C
MLEDDSLMEDGRFVEKADQLIAAITSVRVLGEVEQTAEAENKTGVKSGRSLEARVTPQDVRVSGKISSDASSEDRGLHRETRKGTEQISLNFSDVAKALRELGGTLCSRRVWILLDEWSSVPRDLQPYLAQFLTRCVLPVHKFTVKIAAIEQQSNFRTQVDGATIGIELGANMGAHVNLDDFLVFEGNEERARSFFQGLFVKHLHSIAADTSNSPLGQIQGSLVSAGFTDKRAFDELVRAAEGVPRDALYIAAKAAMKAGQSKISVPLVRDATRGWYHGDKMTGLTSLVEARRLLEWIITEVIRGKRARAFLVNSADARTTSFSLSSMPAYCTFSVVAIPRRISRASGSTSGALTTVPTSTWCRHRVLRLESCRSSMKGVSRRTQISTSPCRITEPSGEPFSTFSSSTESKANRVRTLSNNRMMHPQKRSLPAERRLYDARPASPICPSGSRRCRR